MSIKCLTVFLIQFRWHFSRHVIQLNIVMVSFHSLFDCEWIFTAKKNKCFLKFLLGMDIYFAIEEFFNFPRSLSYFICFCVEFSFIFFLFPSFVKFKRFTMIIDFIKRAFPLWTRWNQKSEHRSENKLIIISFFNEFFLIFLRCKNLQIRKSDSWNSITKDAITRLKISNRIKYE